MEPHSDPVSDDRYPNIVAFDPELDGPDLAAAPEGYETDLSAVGDNRTAAPPDGVEQDWRDLHPNGSREVLGEVPDDPA